MDKKWEAKYVNTMLFPELVGEPTARPLGCHTRWRSGTFRIVVKWLVDYKFFKSSFVHCLNFFLVPMQAFAAALCIVPVENQIITVYISENRAAGCNLIHTCDIQV